MTTQQNFGQPASEQVVLADAQWAGCTMIGSEAASFAQIINTLRATGDPVGVIYLGKPLELNWEQFAVGPRMRATQLVIACLQANYQVLVMNCIGDWGDHNVNPDKPVGYYWQNICHIRSCLDMYLLSESHHFRK